jgi:hypothetical protein
MWDDLIEQDPKMRQMRAESERIGETRGIARSVELGIALGTAQGIAQGIAAMQGTAQNVLKERFPLLASITHADIERIKSLDALQHLIREIIVARDEVTAMRAIDAYLPE